MKKQHKVRKIQGEIVNVSQVFEKHAGVVKNFGIVLRYNSRTTPVNMYKEYRDTTLNGAISQMYMDMSGKHRALRENIQIVKTCVVAKADLRRKEAIEYAKNSITFPRVKPTKRAPFRSLKTLTKANRPTLI
eukprot:scpid111188/ scgid18284/ 60S ribosomal protein L18a